MAMNDASGSRWRASLQSHALMLPEHSFASLKVRNLKRSYAEDFCVTVKQVTRVFGFAVHIKFMLTRLCTLLSMK